MPDLNRRELLQAASAAGAAAALGRSSPASQSGPVVRLSSTSGVLTPPRGRSFNTFSYDFPEPSIQVGDYTVGFKIFTRENVYGLDADAMRVDPAGDGGTLRCDRLVWAGGQERANGSLTVNFRRTADAIEWDALASMDQPIKAVTAIVRGVPRGRLTTGGAPFDPHDDELLWGYPFGAGDLFGGNTAWGMGTPFVAVVAADGPVTHCSSLDDRVRAKRFYFQPGEQGYRVELVHEVEGWLDQARVNVPPWRVGKAANVEGPLDAHYAHLERAYELPLVTERRDAPPWMLDLGLVLSIHQMHWSGYVFNDYARTLEILRWSADRFPAGRTLVFLPAWDGRYYWQYPEYRAAERLGGEAGFTRLVGEARRMGFHVMPMFGMNAANRRMPSFAGVADATVARIDGDVMDINWVDWDSDRHQEGWNAFMNLGVESWRHWLTGRIAAAIDAYGVDGYFLDISGGWTNNTKADMHEGTKLMVAELRRRYPGVLACGEFSYDALIGVLPMFHVPGRRIEKYARCWSHLSHPAPGRGSSGVHESGFGRFDPQTLGLVEGAIPTITVVDDTFTAHRDIMEQILQRARDWRL